MKTRQIALVAFDHGVFHILELERSVEVSSVCHRSSPTRREGEQSMIETEGPRDERDSHSLVSHHAQQARKQTESKAAELAHP